MFHAKKYSSVLLGFALTITSLSANAAPTFEDVRAIKQEIASGESQRTQMKTDIQDTQTRIKALSSERRVFQRKSPAEKDLIQTAKSLEAKLKALEAGVPAEKERLRSNASDYLASIDLTYAERQEVIKNLKPILASGQTAVSQLERAKTNLGLSQFSSGMNAGSSILGALSDQEPTALDALSQLAAQESARQSLKLGQTALRAAANFNDQLSDLARPRDNGILSGTWNGALQRGTIYYLLTEGRNPLLSNGFNLSNSLFQLGDLSEVKSAVIHALGVVKPVTTQIATELKSLQDENTKALDQFLAGL